MPHIRLQKLFFVTVVAKVLTAALGWYLQMPWTLGFLLPLGFMAAYIAIGLRHAQDQIGDEKFADTCYYLGFIFTITAIIFSLFDLPNIGTRIQDIAVRFGAAMVSTVVGLGVRVYLVSFRKDGTDAVHDAEDAVVNAVQRFREQMVMSTERLQQFDADVHQATAATVERSRLQLEKLATDFSQRLEGFFDQLAASNKEAFDASRTEMREATERLNRSFDEYSSGVRANLRSIEAKVTEFSDAVTRRLRQTTFPDDYFAQKLAEPVDALREATRGVAQQVLSVSTEVTESSDVLSGALRKLKTKATAAESALAMVAELATTQQLVLRSAQDQVDALGAATKSFERFDQLLLGLTKELSTQGAATREVSGHLGTTLEEGKALRGDITALLRSVQEQTAAVADFGAQVIARLDKTASLSEAGGDKLAAAAAQLADAARKLDSLRELDAAHAAQARVVTDKLDALLPSFQAAADQMRGLTSANQQRPPAPSLTPPLAIPVLAQAGAFGAAPVSPAVTLGPPFLPNPDAAAPNPSAGPASTVPLSPASADENAPARPQ